MTDTDEFRDTRPTPVGDETSSVWSDSFVEETPTAEPGPIAPQSVQGDQEQVRPELGRRRLGAARDAQGDALSTPIIESPGPGRGYVIDDSVVPGEAGVMLTGLSHAEWKVTSSLSGENLAFAAENSRNRPTSQPTCQIAWMCCG